MPGLAQPVPRRLFVMLGLILILSLAMPEIADSRHKRPQRRSGTAEFTNSFVEAGLQPRTFTCEWAEVLHDYMCSPSPGPDEPDPDDPLPEWNDPPGRFKLKTGLARADRALPPEPPPGREWKGLASREAARVFTCTYDGSGPLSAANYMCSYSNPQLHTFTAAEIVSVCDDERLSPARLSFCADDHKPLWTQDPNDELDDDRALRNIPVEDYVECDPTVVPESGACPERLPPEPRDDYEQPGVGFFELDSWYPPDTTAPDTAVTAAPSGTVASPDATLGFISSEDDSSFECRLGGSAWEECGSPEGYTDLEDGGHSFEVRATDSALNLDPLPAGVTFTVDTTGPRIRISGRRVRLTTRGRARVRVSCPASELSGSCTGALTLKTAKRVKTGSRRRIATLGRKGFALRSGRSAAVKLKLSKRARRLVARHRSIRVRATVRARDRVGNVASARKRFLLVAARR